MVARNLNNPRQISIGVDGSVYIAEAGAAGTLCTNTGGSCLGFTGSITRIRNGRVTRVVRDLASIGSTDGFSALGPQGVSALPDGSLYIAMTALPICDPPPSGVPGRARAQLGHLLRYKGRLSSVADLLPAERTTNPDGQDKEIDPYAVLALSKDRSGATRSTIHPAPRSTAAARSTCRTSAPRRPPAQRTAPAAGSSVSPARRTDDDAADHAAASCRYARAGPRGPCAAPCSWTVTDVATVGPGLVHEPNASPRRGRVPGRDAVRLPTAAPGERSGRGRCPIALRRAGSRQG